MKRIPQLDGVRALAFLAVFIHHAFVIQALWMGVDLFFILSGFLITGILLNAKENKLGAYFGHFYDRRARRILPPYVLFLLLGSFVFGWAWTQHWYFYFLLTNFIFPLHIAHPGVFDPLWSLAVEEQFYLVWPFAVYFLNERHLRQFTLFLIVLAPLLRGSMHFADMWPVYMLTPFRMDLLAVGGLLCLEWRSNRLRIERWGAKLALAMVVIGLLIPFVLHRWGSTESLRIGHPVLYYESTLITCLGVMLYALSGWKVGWLCIRPLTYIGQISYSMYLVHFGMLILVNRVFHGVWISALVGFVLTLAYGAVSWSLLERHLLGRNKPKPKPQLNPA